MTKFLETRQQLLTELDAIIELEDSSGGHIPDEQFVDILEKYINQLKLYLDE